VAGLPSSWTWNASRDDSTSAGALIEWHVARQFGARHACGARRYRPRVPAARYVERRRKHVGTRYAASSAPYSQTHDARVASVASAHAATTWPHPRVNPLIGRERELGVGKLLLLDRHVRLVTLTGAQARASGSCRWPRWRARTWSYHRALAAGPGRRTIRSARGKLRSLRKRLPPRVSTLARSAGDAEAPSSNPNTA
jgi:hypothetical protein